MKNVQKRSGAVGNVFLCVQKCIRTDGAPWSEPHIFHTHFKSSDMISRALVLWCQWTRLTGVTLVLTIRFTSYVLEQHGASVFCLSSAAHSPGHESHVSG